MFDWVLMICDFGVIVVIVLEFCEFLLIDGYIDFLVVVFNCIGEMVVGVFDCVLMLEGLMLEQEDQVQVLIFEMMVDVGLLFYLVYGEDDCICVVLNSLSLIFFEGFGLMFGFGVMFVGLFDVLDVVVVSISVNI